MGFIDGASAGDLTPFRWSALGMSFPMGIVPVRPSWDERIPSTLVPITVLIDSSGGTNVDLEIQVATNATFTVLVSTLTATNQPDGEITLNASGLVNKTRYYWRARIAPTGTTNWGPWSGLPTLGNDYVLSNYGLTATASSTLSGAYAASKAFNGTVGADADIWAAASVAPPHWVAAQLTSAPPVASYRVSPRNDGGSPGALRDQIPKSWTFEGSNDGTTWTVLDTQTNVTWTGATPRTFTLAATASYTRYRLHMTAAIGAGGTQTFSLSELTLRSPDAVAGAPMTFVVDTDAGRAYGYVTANIGIDPLTVVDDAHTYVTNNVGVEQLLSDDAHTYVHQNVGVPINHEDFGHAYVYEGDVSTNAPTPHLWFLWRPFGFAGNEVWAYGHGFGNPQSEYGGLMRIDPGPDYTTADVNAGVNEWYLQQVTEHAYDEQRTIYPGTGDIPPRVDMEVEIVRFVIPSEIMPADDRPVTQRMYVQNAQGPSNKVNWLMYPTIPVAAGNVQRNVGTKTIMRLAADFAGAGIEQLWFFTDEPDYVISGGMPQRVPLFNAVATTVAQLGTWSAEDSLSEALSVNLGADQRWLPDEAKLAPRPDLGTGVTVWEASAGATTKGWRLDADSAPYVDPAYSIPSRLGDLDLPAMIFPGDAFGRFTAPLAAGPAYTFAMVAVLHAPPTGRGTVFSTFREGIIGPEFYDLEIYYENGVMKVTAGGKYISSELQNGLGRPVIIVNRVSTTGSQLILVDDRPSSHVTAGMKMKSSGNHAYLGRSYRIDEGMNPASMDVLDLAWWDAPLSSAAMWSVANKLDGIYGVTG